VLAIFLFFFPKWQERKGEVHPLTRSWDIAVPNQVIPEGLTSISSEQCGSCHQQHYAEWQLSTHALAWKDPQFQAEIRKESSPFMCINCHIPLQNQQEYIVTGLIDGDIYQPVKEKNPQYDAALQQEGINCASCHVRDGAVIGTSGAIKAPHKTIIDKEFLSEQLCISCHNANATLTPEVVCTFQTGEEWQAGAYFGKKNCISCHMEGIKRENVQGAGHNLSHHHYFPGSGIPKSDTLQTTHLNGMGIYPSTLKQAYSVSEEIEFSLKVVNEAAGHRLPTGDPERFYNITIELRDFDGEVLASKSARIGELWEWYPVAKKLSDNNLEIGEERSFTLAYTAKDAESLQLFVEVTKHRLSQEFAKYNKLSDDYPLSITIFSETYPIEVIPAI